MTEKRDKPMLQNKPPLGRFKTSHHLDIKEAGKQIHTLLKEAANKVVTNASLAHVSRTNILGDGGGEVSKLSRR